MTDSEIAAKMASDPEQGFRMLFDEYHNYVYTIAYNILRNTASSRDIEDCVVDVMSDTMMNYDHDNGGSLKAYIGTLAKHRAIDISRAINRKTARTLSVDDSPINEFVSDENVASNVENADIARIIMEKIEEMGPPDSEILIQKYFFDRNSTAIARVMKMNPVTVRSRCSRAVKRLKKILTELDITL